MKANLLSVNWELTGPLPSHRQGNGRAGKGGLVCMWKGHRGDRDNGQGDESEHAVGRRAVPLHLRKTP